MHIQFDSEQFDPKRLMSVRHDFADHPMFTLDALMTLAKRLPRERVRFHATTARADSDFERTTEEHPHTLGLEEAMANMETSGSWIALHNVQSDPEYRAILDEALDEVRARIDAKDPGMFHRAFWIFISSPNSVTPFHIDHENNFLMQVRGKKRALLWHAEDCIPALALETFHSQWNRKEVHYDPSFDRLAQVHELEPGMGAYMPSTAPHLVSNHDNVSITISMTYCTRETRRVETVHRCNHALRKRGLAPRDVGASAVGDMLKGTLFGGLLAARSVLKGDFSSTPGWAR